MLSTVRWRDVRRASLYRLAQVPNRATSATQLTHDTENYVPAAEDGRKREAGRGPAGKTLAGFAAHFADLADVGAQGAKEKSEKSKTSANRALLCCPLLGLQATYPLYQRRVGCEDGECRGSQRDSLWGRVRGLENESKTKGKRQRRVENEVFFSKFFCSRLVGGAFKHSLASTLFSRKSSQNFGLSKKQTNHGPAQASGKLVLGRR